MNESPKIRSKLKLVKARESLNQSTHINYSKLLQDELTIKAREDPLIFPNYCIKRNVTDQGVSAMLKTRKKAHLELAIGSRKQSHKSVTQNQKVAVSRNTHEPVTQLNEGGYRAATNMSYQDGEASPDKVAKNDLFDFMSKYT